MAVINISEAEAVLDLSGLIAKVRAGQEVRIAAGDTEISLVEEPKRKTLSEAIRLAEERDDDVTLDDQFSRDLEQVILNHEHEAEMRDRWAE